MSLKTFDELMNGMLERIAPDIDTQQGSIMWDILSPMALEMNALY